MNYFVEGLQGSGKSTLVEALSKKHTDLKAIREGDYSPIELAWCAYVSKDKYREILDKYSNIREMIEEKSFEEGDNMIICYTQIITDVPGFHRDLEQYEIYNGRRDLDEFKEILLKRYRGWNGDKTIFECSLLQNTVEDMILFRCMSDEEILGFYKEVREALEGKDYQIFYLKADDIQANIDVIRKERSDDKGNELWFPLMMGYFNDCPYAQKRGLSGEDELIKHLQHRQELELRICQEIFADKCMILRSKGYDLDNCEKVLLAVKRITKMEAILDKVVDCQEDLLKFQPEIKELEEYYSSQDWKDDFALDEEGQLPKGLKRGVLSEDGIYNVLERYRELL